MVRRRKVRLRRQALDVGAQHHGRARREAHHEESLLADFDMLLTVAGYQPERPAD